MCIYEFRVKIQLKSVKSIWVQYLTYAEFVVVFQGSDYAVLLALRSGTPFDIMNSSLCFRYLIMPPSGSEVGDTICMLRMREQGK